MHAAGQPSAQRAGLTDPGTHAIGSSLPFMWRGRGALASPLTRITIDAVPYEVPVRVNHPPHYVGLHGYYTVQHWMAIIRAGAARACVNDAERQTVTREWREGQAYITRIHQAALGTTEGFGLLFSEGKFQVDMDGAGMVCEGSVESIAVADGHHRVRLLPEAPAWAAARAVTVDCLRDAQGWRFETRVG